MHMNVEKRNQLATPEIHVTLPSNGYVKQQRNPKRDKVQELEEGSAHPGRLHPAFQCTPKWAITEERLSHRLLFAPWEPLRGSDFSGSLRSSGPFNGDIIGNKVPTQILILWLWLDFWSWIDFLSFFPGLAFWFPPPTTTHGDVLSGSRGRLPSFPKVELSKTNYILALFFFWQIPAKANVISIHS